MYLRRLAAGLAVAAALTVGTPVLTASPAAAVDCWDPNEQSGGTYVKTKNGESAVYHHGPYGSCPGGGVYTRTVNFTCHYQNSAGSHWFYARDIGWIYHSYLSMSGSEWPARTCTRRDLSAS
ncbi:hypothetical protein AB0K49_37215 [Streptomyces decoyicus]|uniref:hypothetical protein n=1 Tax=Streptomyces decoyicus TaxID=249567 RepID=UPI00345DF526